MGHKILNFLCLALLLAFINCQTPPNWGNNPTYTVSVYMVYDDPAVNWTFTYYYDWNKKVEKYEHQKGQQD